MQIFKFILFASVLASCNTYEKQPPEAKNDTTEVLKVAIAKAFYQYNLPSMSPLMKKCRSSDSMLFSSDSLSLALLPTNLDSINFKILKREQWNKGSSLVQLSNNSTTAVIPGNECQRNRLCLLISVKFPL